MAEGHPEKFGLSSVVNSGGGWALEGSEQRVTVV